MTIRIALPVLLAAALAAPLAAEPWKEVDRLTGDIAVELDEGSVVEALDGVSLVLFATFRRQMPSGVMETDVAMDCAHASSRLRGVRLIDGGQVYNRQGAATAEMAPVRYGSADAIYFKTLCGRELEVPPLTEDAAGEAGEEAASNAG